MPSLIPVYSERERERERPKGRLWLERKITLFFCFTIIVNYVLGSVQFDSVKFDSVQFGSKFLEPVMIIKPSKWPRGLLFFFEAGYRNQSLRISVSRFGSLTHPPTTPHLLYLPSSDKRLLLLLLHQLIQGKDLSFTTQSIYFSFHEFCYSDRGWAASGRSYSGFGSSRSGFFFLL